MDRASTNHATLEQILGTAAVTRQQQMKDTAGGEGKRENGTD